jgi:antitoxin (DNA-binding transcriptional repressor) of toxin-antitoxin stability system
MKAASVAEMETGFSAFVEASEAGPIVVTRDGKPVAILVGVGDEDDVERLLMACSPKLKSILDKSRQSIREGRGIPHDEFWSKFVPSPDTKKPAKRKGSKK